MVAVIAYKTKQYEVSEGSEILIPYSEIETKTIKFDQVLLLADDKGTTVGTPNIEGASVEGDVIGSERSEKIRVFKFRAKKRYKRTHGQRDKFIRIKITKIAGKSK
jgi:large subunit ribosomal protein L21